MPNDDIYDTLPDVEKQSQRKKNVIDFVTKNKDVGERLTRAALKSKIEWLENILEEFQTTHDIILNKGKSDIPYIATGSGQKTIDYIHSVIAEFRLRRAIDDVPPLSSTIIEPKSTDDEDQNRRIRQLNLRLKNLSYAIEEMFNDVDTCDVISKEFFETKNKFLENQWAAISSLEEDILMCDEHALGDVCQNALKNINVIVKHMSDKICTAPSPANSQNNHFDYDSKLPELKVPIFKGDYKCWCNFRDLFLSLVHNKKKLTLVQKMEYLKTFVDGEPLRLISSYTLSAANYEKAWAILVKRYDNKRKLLTIHLDNMRKPIGKPATSRAVKELHDSITEGLTSIENLGVDTSNWDPIIIHLALENLDTESRSYFEEKFTDDSNKIPKLETFMKCLESRYTSLEVLESLKPKQQVQSNGTKMLYAEERSPKECTKCNGEHRLWMCPKFLALSVNSRYRFVKQHRLCYRCLTKHTSKVCDPTPKPCKDCKSEKHSSLLHFERKGFTNKTKANLCQEVTSDDPGKVLSAMGFNNENNHDVLATALLQVRDVFGNPFTIRVLIDTGAQKNYITETLAQRLRLPRESCCTDVTGISNVKAFKVKHVVNVNVEPTFPSNFDKDITALVMGKELTSSVPENSINERLPKEWLSMQLADPTFMTPNSIDMVMGIGFFAKILLPEMKTGDNTKLIALNSQIGWLIFGETKMEKTGVYKNVKTLLSLSDTNEDISKFWELEEIAPQRFLSPQDEECEQNYESSHTRLDDGRYMVSIPFKSDLKVESNLGSSRKRAMCRFLSLETKFKSNQSLYEEYKGFIQEYIRLGHMRPIEDDKSDPDVYFMPHHAVLKPESTSTKLRVVFDASAKTSHNYSLNEIMLSGPRLQDDLSTILLRWRYHKFVITADIEKMYRQILITPSHRKYQRIYWRDSVNEPIKAYELSTVTYGTTSAPYLAVKTLQQLAKDEQHNFPQASQIVLEDFYVDDLLTGADSIEECKARRKELDTLLNKGGFTLRKWSSNVENVLEDVLLENRSKHMLDFNDTEEKSLKTLGLIWKPQEDVFMFRVNALDFDSVKKTKRTLCSDISKIFDPLGWLAPITIVAKMLFQQTWKEQSDWNDELPDHILKGWKLFRQNLCDIENLRIKRWINTSVSDDVELHGFCDASEGAYAAAIYVKTRSPEGNVSVNLLMAKTKVAPIKQELTVAKLELCGALLLAKLYSYVTRTFNWADKKFNAWCDSKIVLAWIQGDPSRWKIFVANRISQIQQHTKKEDWHYVPTDQNCADCATRGLTAHQLRHHELWWFGPKWLKEEEANWPTSVIEDIVESPEFKKRTVNINTALPKTQPDIECIISRFSSYNRMKYVIAYCLRFSHNCKGGDRRSGSLTNDEISNSERTIIKLVQCANFEEDVKNLQNSRPLNNKNGILSLSPMLDEFGLLRIVGRLQNSYLSYDEKHPFILPYKSRLSYLIAFDAHLRCNHGLNSLTEYIVRRRFWIVKLKTWIKAITHHCVPCRRKSPQRLSQMMGQLPENRITFNNAFYSCGVDYAGPFDTKPWKGRCNKKYKSYVCVFVCMTTKAVHLELISDLTAEGFMAAYRRFSSRRGPCLHIHSDCGSNFIGANKIMTSDLKKFQQQWLDDIKPLSVRGISWHFNPPASPHAGGLWEAAVRSMKNLLTKHLSNIILTYEEFSTLLIQVEGCLNSRPLGALRDNTEDQSVLTPSHFLTGVPLFSNPEPEIENCTLADRWRYVQRLKQQFSKEFRVQMTQSLQVRRKWKQPAPNIKLNDVVMVDESSELATNWPLGLVKDVHPGKDGLVRVATIKMESGRLLKRPITKLAQLPVLDKKDANEVPTKTASEIPDSPRYNLRKRSAKTTTMALWIGILFTFLEIGASQSNPAHIKKFENNSGLFFANIGKMKASTNDWVILLYYNMSSFQYEFEDITKSVNNFEKRCSNQPSLYSYCTMITTDMKQRISELAEDNEIIMSLNHEVEPLLRQKRMAQSILPFVGTLSKAVFGTLDEGYAREMEYTIANLQRDDRHMMGLIRNHTSIMETFLNNARLSQNRTDQQFQWVSKNLQSLDNVIRTIEEQNILVIRLQLLATHLSNRMNRLETAQSSIIQCVTNAQHGNFRSILHPAVLKEQLKIMKTSLPAEISIPVTSDNIIRLYSLLSVHTRVSDNFILFKFTLPLVTMNKYEIYKPIPLPMKINQEILIIQPSVEFIAVSLHRDKYIELTSAELSQCVQLDEETSLCKEHRPEMKNIPIYNSCEMTFFVHQKISTEKCKLITVPTKQMWIQLPSPNQWVYSTFDPEHFNIICNDTVQKLTLEGEGIITMNPKCILEHKAFTIPGVEGFVTTLTNQFYFPEVNLPIDDEKNVVHLNVNRSSVMLRNTDDLLDIERALGSIKNNQELSSVSSVEKWSFYSLIVTSLVTISGIAFVAFKAWRWYRKPVPAPRRCNQEPLQVSVQGHKETLTSNPITLDDEESLHNNPGTCPLESYKY